MFRAPFRKSALFSLLLACAAAVHAAPPGPGYGKVQSIIPLQAQPAEPSASAGGSSPSKARPTQAYLMRIRMDDGRIQVRQVKRREVAVGQRVLVTNAGDVLPE